MLIMSSTVASAAVKTTEAAAAAASSGILPSVYNNVQVVGFAWMLTSALFTTYSTTMFLKYPTSPIDNNTSPFSAYRKLQKQSNKKEVAATSSSFPSPASAMSRAGLLTLYRFSGSLLLGLIAHPDFHVIARIKETWNLVPSFALPAMFLFIANYSNSISLNRIGISLTYTSKCSIPLFTVFLTLLIDGIKSLPRYTTLLTLIPIAVGIGAASWDHPTFEAVGFAAAMISCTAQSLLNVSCKKVMSSLEVSGPIAQRVMVSVGLALSLLQVAIVSAREGARSLTSRHRSNELKPLKRQPPAWLATMALTAYHLEYTLSFIFVKLVSPITYGASDAVRRLFIIISGHYMFGGHPFTPTNIAGIAMALIGALAYSILNAH